MLGNFSLWENWMQYFPQDIFFPFLYTFFLRESPMPVKTNTMNMSQTNYYILSNKVCKAWIRNYFYYYNPLSYLHLSRWIPLLPGVGAQGLAAIMREESNLVKLNEKVITIQFSCKRKIDPDKILFISERIIAKDCKSEEQFVFLCTSLQRVHK